MEELDCGQTCIPSCDNTPLVCEEMINPACVMLQGSYPYLGLTGTFTLQELLERLEQVQKNNKILLNSLQSQIDGL